MANDAINSTLTQERLKERLNYNADTGDFVWRLTGQRSNKVKKAGNTSGRMYLRISVDGVRYQAHRLAWMYVHGEWPDGEIDHINGDGSDNRIDNLRVVSRGENQQNLRAPHKTSTSGVLGAFPCHGKWKAAIKVDKKNIYLGRYKTKEEAHAAYLDAKRLLHSTCTI